MPNVFRLHIRPTGGLANKRLAFEHCLSTGVLGLGWALPGPSDRSITWAAYVAEAERCYGTGGELSRVKYFHHHVQPDDLIWTRDLGGRYYLARVLDSWRYDDTQSAWDADVVNVVSCEIRDIGFVEAVPGKVIACFRPTRAVQQIADETVRIFSQALWNQAVGLEHYLVPKRPMDFFALLDDRAIEDIVLIYLQLKGWLILPSTRQRDTIAYEAILVHRDSGKRAVVQVKSGDTPLDPHRWSGRDVQVFLFQAQGRYTTEAPAGVECIPRRELQHLVESKLDLFPKAVGVWHRFAVANG